MISHADFSALTLLEFCHSHPSYRYEDAEQDGDLMIEAIFGFFRFVSKSGNPCSDSRN